MMSFSSYYCCCTAGAGIVVGGSASFKESIVVVRLLLAQAMAEVHHFPLHKSVFSHDLMKLYYTSASMIWYFGGKRK